VEEKFKEGIRAVAGNTYISTKVQAGHTMGVQLWSWHGVDGKRSGVAVSAVVGYRSVELSVCGVTDIIGALSTNQLYRVNGGRL
jgi:hypothetical protein